MAGSRQGCRDVFGAGGAGRGCALLACALAGRVLLALVGWATGGGWHHSRWGGGKGVRVWGSGGGGACASLGAAQGAAASGFADVRACGGSWVVKQGMRCLPACCAPCRPETHLTCLPACLPAQELLAPALDTPGLVRPPSPFPSASPPRPTTSSNSSTRSSTCTGATWRTETSRCGVVVWGGGPSSTRVGRGRGKGEGLVRECLGVAGQRRGRGPNTFAVG